MRTTPHTGARLLSRLFLERIAPSLVLVIALAGSTTIGRAQGCVAIKQMDGSEVCSLDGHTLSNPDKWSFSVNYEHFRSHRHFIGSDQEFQRYPQGSEVINVVNEVDGVLTYNVDPRDDVYIDVPYFNATRSSLYEHDHVNRYVTHGIGLGDIRVGAERWLRNPLYAPANNVALGVAVSTPTGKSNVKDYFHEPGGVVYHNVDQSIQPGMGVWGFAVTGRAYQRLTSRASLYASAFYLFNPAQTNGTRTQSPVTSVTAYNSAYDEYQMRAGVNYLLTSKYTFTGSLGIRVEGVPGTDVFGGDAGFRRPGYVESIEPGLSLSPTPHDTFTLAVPYAFRRDRTLSYADKLAGTHGDAAFADYLINVSYTHGW